MELAALPVLQDRAIADGKDAPLARLLPGGVGQKDTPLVFSSASRRRTTTFGPRGIILMGYRELPEVEGTAVRVTIVSNQCYPAEVNFRTPPRPPQVNGCTLPHMTLGRIAPARTACDVPRSRQPMVLGQAHRNRRARPYNDPAAKPRTGRSAGTFGPEPRRKPSAFGGSRRKAGGRTRLGHRLLARLLLSHNLTLKYLHEW